MILKLIILFSSFNFSNAKIVHREKTQDYNIVLKEMASDLHIPWGMEFLNKNTLLVNQKNGKMILIDLKTGKKTNITHSVSVTEKGQGGSMDVVKHPNYPTTPWIYWTYVSKDKGQLFTNIARFQLKKNKMIQFEKLMSKTKSKSDTSRHFGSRIAFDHKGFLYFSIGDRGHRPNGQNLKTHAGSILRLHDDGRIPKDNPFVNSKEALPEIWSYGHRNPQGLSYDPVEKKLWVIEHGPRGGDEINLVEKGKNYGWATISYGKEYYAPIAVGESTHQKGMEQPVHHYIPSIAPCGMAVYQGRMFPKWQGSLLSGALKLTHLNRVELKNGQFVKEERLLKSFSQRIRHVKQAPDGSVFISTDSGQILKILMAKAPVKSI